jgi:uncharacterized protein YjbJ (UPF0337 family)
LNKQYLEGSWNEIKGKIQERWGDLTDDDLDRIEGKRDQLIGAIQKRYGRARDEAENELHDWEKKEGYR